MPLDRTMLAELRAIPRSRAIDPYPVYRYLLLEAPVWQSPWGDIYVSRYADVSAVLRNPNCLQRSPVVEPSVGSTPDVPEPQSDMAEWPIFLNPPDHAAVRQALGRLITAIPQDRIRRIIAECAAGLADRIGDGPFCLVEDFAAQLPVGVISDICGIPRADRHRVAGWAHVLRDVLDSGFDLDSRLHVETMREGVNYFRQLSSDPAWRRHAFGGKAHEVIDSMPERSAASNLFFLVFSGHETTIHLIGALVRLLVSTPGAWSRLREDRSLLAGAVREALRLESPVQKICRTNSEPLHLSYTSLPEGAEIVLLIGAANRDPRAFADPDRFDPERSGPRHLAFGAGRHMCLGNQLAVWEAEISLGVLLDNWADVNVAGEACHLANTSFRGLSQLPLERTAPRSSVVRPGAIL